MAQRIKERNVRPAFKLRFCLYQSTLLGAKGIFLYSHQGHRSKSSIHTSNRALVCPWYRVSSVSSLSSAFVLYACSMAWTSFLYVRLMLAMVIVLTSSPSWSVSFVLLLLYLFLAYCSILDTLESNLTTIWMLKKLWNHRLLRSESPLDSHISSSISPNLPSLDVTHFFTSATPRVLQ